MGYMEKLKTASCKEGELLLMWMGQAGFVLKNSAGKILAIDVYLSDLAIGCARRPDCPWKKYNPYGRAVTLKSRDTGWMPSMQIMGIRLRMQLAF